VCISRLRKVVGNDAIETRAPGYLLHVAPGELDLDRFRQLVEDSRAAEDPVALLRAAERLWRGFPLADLEDERFARAEIGPLAELLPSAIEERVAAELALGRHAALVPELEALVEAYPLRERMRAQLMLALYRAGRQADALAAYRAGRVRLVEELGLNPGPELVALETAILRHDPDLDLAAPATRPAGRRRRLVAPVLASLAVAAGVLAITLPDGPSRAALSPIRGNAAVLFGAHGVTASAVVGAAPSRAVAGFGSLWITHVDAGTVTRVDLGTRTVRQTVRVGAGPIGVAIADGAVWVANSLAGTVSRIDPETGTVVQTVTVGSGPSALAAAGATLWVAVRGAGVVARIDARRGRVVDRVRTGRGPSALALRGDVLWVANDGEGTVARIDAATGTVVQTVRAGDSPTALAATADGVWVADRLDATLAHIARERGAVASTLALGGAPGDVIVHAGRVWATVAGALAEIDARRETLVRTMPVGERAGPLAIADGQLWVGLSAGGAHHRGGTLTIAVANDGEEVLDPALGGPVTVFGLSYDGLVGFDHQGSSRLVPDLAITLPLPRDDGRTYSFRLRPGIRFSDGTAVRPSDVRRSFERIDALGSSGADIFTAVREVAADDRRGTVTFHLAERDPEFL
jgi:YVTN family beta-propeller protein